MAAEGKTLGTVPVAEVAEHIQHLMDAGVSQYSIARTAGVSWYTLNRIRHGERDKVLAVTAKKILEVRPQRITDIPECALVDPTGLMRRLRALTAIGYTANHLSRELGMSATQVLRYLQGVESVRFESDKAVKELFDRLQMSPLPRGRSTSRAMNDAARNGWVPPLAWDENSIDDPAAEPFGVRVELVKLPRAERVEDYHEMRSWGLSDARIAERLGVGEKYLLKLVGEAA